jgi:hypothetical protein
MKYEICAILSFLAAYMIMWAAVGLIQYFSHTDIDIHQAALNSLFIGFWIKDRRNEYKQNY